jgi:NADH:ubiquinone oxidoreductase subunit F (NADH-binding)
LVDNVETLANIALIARFGAPWWREVGTRDEAGTVLLTVSGAVERPGVYEAAIGSSLERVLAAAGAHNAAGFLVGGYFGTWLPSSAGSLSLSRHDLAPLGAGLGCGVVSVMPDDVCPAREVARVAHWLAGQSAGQCGPCVNGLPAIARALDALAAGQDARSLIDRWSTMVRGRGGCRLPDGAASFVRSALDVFGDHFAAHVSGRCTADPDKHLLVVPGAGVW